MTNGHKCPTFIHESKIYIESSYWNIFLIGITTGHSKDREFFLFLIIRDVPEVRRVSTFIRKLGNRVFLLPSFLSFLLTTMVLLSYPLEPAEKGVVCVSKLSVCI